MIVIGLGFGDEGKGLTTSYLCDQVNEPIIVRFNGGHQAGHTVVYDDKCHVFSSFGSGTLQGAPTYWSAFCTIHPVAFMNEWNVLVKLKEDTYPAEFIAHPLCPITTPYDVKYNQMLEDSVKIGSVGVGFGATIQRQEHFYKLHLQDLLYPRVFHAKLRNIRDYYIGVEVSDEELDLYLQAVDFMMSRIKIDDYDLLKRNKSRLIFEGAQGILLDKDMGFFPNVTRSNTTSQNAMTLMGPDIGSVYYVTRCYQTRHGAGFMTCEDEHLGLINNKNETNIYTPWQGKFRVGTLDPDLLRYALNCDAPHVKKKEKNLVITCCDQLEGFDPDKIIDEIGTYFERVYLSKGPTLDDIEEYT